MHACSEHEERSMTGRHIRLAEDVEEALTRASEGKRLKPAETEKLMLAARLIESLCGYSENVLACERGRLENANFARESFEYIACDLCPDQDFQKVLNRLRGTLEHIRMRGRARSENVELAIQFFHDYGSHMLSKNVSGSIL